MKIISVIFNIIYIIISRIILNRYYWWWRYRCGCCYVHYERDDASRVDKALRVGWVYCVIWLAVKCRATCVAVTLARLSTGTPRGPGPTLVPRWLRTMVNLAHFDLENDGVLLVLDIDILCEPARGRSSRRLWWLHSKRTQKKWVRQYGNTTIKYQLDLRMSYNIYMHSKIFAYLKLEYFSKISLYWFRCYNLTIFKCKITYFILLWYYYNLAKNCNNCLWIV